MAGSGAQNSALCSCAIGSLQKDQKTILNFKKHKSLNRQFSSMEHFRTPRTTPTTYCRVSPLHLQLGRQSGQACPIQADFLQEGNTESSERDFQVGGEMSKD